MIHNTTCTCPAVSSLAVARCSNVSYSISTSSSRRSRFGHISCWVSPVTATARIFSEIKLCWEQWWSCWYCWVTAAVSPAPQLRSAAADVVWLLIWLLQPRYQSRQVNTALGFTTTSRHRQPDTDTQHGLRFNTGDIQKCGARVVLGYYYNSYVSEFQADLGSSLNKTKQSDNLILLPTPLCKSGTLACWDSVNVAYILMMNKVIIIRQLYWGGWQNY